MCCWWIDCMSSRNRGVRWRACWMCRWHHHCVIADVIWWRWRRWWRCFDCIPRSLHGIQLMTQYFRSASWVTKLPTIFWPNFLANDINSLAYDMRVCNTGLLWLSCFLVRGCGNLCVHPWKGRPPQRWRIGLRKFLAIVCYRQPSQQCLGSCNHFIYLQ